MVFPRGKMSASEPAAGTGSLTFTIPDYVKPGDYCIVWVSTTDTSATLTKPSWLTQIESAQIGSTNKLVLFGGFVPDPIASGNGNFTCNHTTTRGWLYSASFWGGVKASNPIAFSDIVSAGLPSSNAQFALAQLIYSDNFDGALGDLSGKNLDVGATSWTTSGASTDFLKTNAYSIDSSVAYRQVSSGFRYAVCGSAIDNVKIVGLEGWIDVSNTYPAMFPTILLRWTNANNHIKAILRCDVTKLDSTYSRLDLTLSINVVVGGAIVQTAVKSLTTTVWGSGVHNRNNSYGFQKWRIKASVGTNGDIELKLTESTLPNDSVKISASSYAVTGGALDDGLVGFADYSDPGALLGTRFYTQFDAWGGSAPNSNVLVAASVVGNSDTQTITATPRNGVQFDQVLTGPAPPDANAVVGRSLYLKYFQDTGIVEYSLDVTDNLEVGAANVDTLGAGWIALNNESTTNTISLRSTESIESGWKFYLANSSDMSHIGELNARDRTLSWALNRPGDCSFTISLDDPIAQQVDLVSTCIVAYRDGDIKWSGPVWSIDESAANNSMTVSAVGWLQLLEKRLNSPINEKFLRFDVMDASTIAAHLVALTNIANPLPFSIGGTENTFTTKRSYQKYTAISGAIQELSDIENGYDFWLDPATRQLIFYKKLEEDLSGSIAFGYNAGFLNNLAEVSRQRSADKLVNGIYAVTSTSGTTPPEQLDQTSIDQYGLMEEQASLSEANDAKIALAYAAGEFVYRSSPLPIYSITPRPSANGPRVLKDYHIGSIMKFSANKGAIQVANQKFKVFSISLSIDNAGNETVTQMNITAS